MRNGKRPDQTVPHCAVCGGPIYDLDTLAPGEMAMHPRCSEISHQQAMGRLGLTRTPPCDVCGRLFETGQRTAEAQICEDCLAPRKYGTMRSPY